MHLAGPSCTSGESHSDFHLAGVSEAGDVYVWHCSSPPSTSGRTSEGSNGVEGQLIAHVRVDSSKG